jgi:hypothetical protein
VGGIAAADAVVELGEVGVVVGCIAVVVVVAEVGVAGEE